MADNVKKVHQKRVGGKRRGKGAGCVYKKGNIFIARWVVSLEGGTKVFTRSTQTGNRAEALKKLEEFVAPFRLGTQEKILRCQVAELNGVREQIKQMEEERPALGILGAWMAYRNAPNRPDSGVKTLEMYESQYGRFVTWMEKNHPAVKELRKVTEEMAFAFASDLGQVMTANTYNKYLVLFRRIWKTLAKPARLTENPWNELQNRVLSTHCRRELTVEELVRVCGSVTGEMRLLFAVGIYCGLRLGDAVRLTWGNVDLIRQLVMVVPSKTARRAQGKVLKIPVHHSLLAMFLETPSDRRNGFVMPELAALYEHDDRTLVKHIKKVFTNCGIETMIKVEGRKKHATEVGFHSLRHSFVSLSANAGANLAAVQAVIGHTSPAMTRHYLHADQNNIKNAVALLPDVTGLVTVEGATEAEVSEVGKVMEKMTDEQLKALTGKLQELVTQRAGKKEPEPAAA